MFLTHLPLRMIGCAAFATVVLVPAAIAEIDDPFTGMAPPLLPQVACADQRCSIRFAGLFDGNTVVTGPMPFDLNLSDDPSWQPVRIREETLKINVEIAPFGWTIGGGETATELFLTPLTEWGMEAEARVFMIEQRAGFDHLAVAYRFFAFDDMDASALLLVHAIGPNTGPQTVVTAATMQNIDVVTPVYDAEADDFVPLFESLAWHIGPEGLALASPAEMEAINARTDRLGD